MSEIRFTLQVEPMSLQSSGKRMIIRGGKPLFFKNAKAAEYQRTIKVLAKEYAPTEPFSGPLIVDFVFIIARPGRLNRKSDPAGLIPCPARPDRDNLQKGTQDALSDFWIDDGQIYDGRTAKFYAEKDGDPRIIVTIRQPSFLTDPVT
jgi:Holliday junction resolvase RusA-like endonuclease